MTCFYSWKCVLQIHNLEFDYQFTLDFVYKIPYDKKVIRTVLEDLSGSAQ